MNDVTFYFQVHQPFRLRAYRFFDIGHRDDYFDDAENERIARRVASKCYLPMNDLLLRAIEEHGTAFRCSFSISGTALDQFEAWSPETIDSFRALAATGCVEFLAETSQHSLAALFDEEEFSAQIEAQAARIERLFGRRPTTFRNTELVVDNRIARLAEQAGFQGILGEGADHLLGWRSPHAVYRPEGCERIKTLLRSYRLSDDIAFRFSNRAWEHWPLRAETFSAWLQDAIAGLEDQVVGLFMDYETFGEHQWEDTGIFAFMKALPAALLGAGNLRFATPSEVFERHDPIGRIDIPHPVSWADAERDLTAWLGNHMQRSANEALWDIGRDLRGLASRCGDREQTRDAEALLAKWRKLTTSDHLYYMCTKFFSDGDVHKYFSPYATPHDAFIAFMNVVDDLARRVEGLRASLQAPAADTSSAIVELMPRESTRAKSAEVLPCGEGKVEA